VRERELLGDHAPERLPVDVRAGKLELVQERDGVLDEGRHRHRLIRRVGAAVPAEVECHDEQLAREVGDVPSPPRDVAAHALQQDDGRVRRIAVGLVVQPAAVGPDEPRHGDPADR